MYIPHSRILSATQRFLTLVIVLFAITADRALAAKGMTSSLRQIRTINRHDMHMANPDGLISALGAGPTDDPGQMSRSETTNLTFQGEVVDDAPKYGSSNPNYSSRGRTIASMLWSPPEWTTEGTDVALNGHKHTYEHLAPHDPNETNEYRGVTPELSAYKTDVEAKQQVLLSNLKKEMELNVSR